jgi:hypothetical protein
MKSKTKRKNRQPLDRALDRLYPESRAPGRPKNPLTERTMIRLTPEDLVEFQAAAERLGELTGVSVSVGAWLRMVGRKVLDDEKRAVVVSVDNRCSNP